MGLTCLESSFGALRLKISLQIPCRKAQSDILIENQKSHASHASHTSHTLATFSSRSALHQATFKAPSPSRSPFTKNNEALRSRSASQLAVLQLCLTITHQPKDIEWRCENVASANVTAYSGNDTSSYSRQLSPATSDTFCIEGGLLS